MMSPEHCSWHPLFQQNVSSSTFLPCDSQQDPEWRSKWRTRYLCVVPSLSGHYGLTCGPFNLVVDLPIWGWSHCRCSWHRWSHIEQIRPQSDTHGVFMERRCLDTDAHGDHVKMEAEVSAMPLQAKECRRLPAMVSLKLKTSLPQFQTAPDWEKFLCLKTLSLILVGHP